MKLQSPLRFFSEKSLIFFIVLLFPLLGTDNPTLVQPRIWCGILIYLFFWAVHARGHFFSKNIGRLPCIFFGAVIIFVLLRSFWGYLVVHHSHFSGSPLLRLDRYMNAPLRWFFFFMTFVTGYLAFKRKKIAWLTLNAMSWAGFFLAVNALPALLLTGKSSYVDMHQKRGFFFPFFYAMEWVPKYVMNRFAHPNYVGDIMAFGLFAALGLAAYCFHIMRLQKKGEDVSTEGHFTKALVPFICLRFVIAISIVIAVFLLLSRGTISCFVLTLVIFAGLLFLKFFKRLPWMVVVAGAGIAISVLVWAIDFKKVSKELQTLQVEMDPNNSHDRSDDTNIEGYKRALAIYHAFPVWGVGTKGYVDVSPSFSFSLTPLNFADAVVMNHYLQTLAEEGVGAFLYFAFLMMYLIDVLKGLILTKSRFKFVASLTFFAPVVMVLVHASFNHLMEGFGTQTMVYLSMGASLSVLRADFEHQ